MWQREGNRGLRREEEGTGEPRKHIIHWDIWRVLWRVLKVYEIQLRQEAKRMAFGNYRKNQNNQEGKNNYNILLGSTVNVIYIILKRLTWIPELVKMIDVPNWKEEGGLVRQ